MAFSLFILLSLWLSSPLFWLYFPLLALLGRGFGVGPVCASPASCKNSLYESLNIRGMWAGGGNDYNAWELPKLAPSGGGMRRGG